MIEWRVGLARVCGLVIMAIVCAPGVVSASCATDEPSPSPYAFVGTMIDTAKNDRFDTVITDDGLHVTVRGTPGAWFSTGMSSTDRRLALGGRYEFHPINATDPYQDNSCTTTRQLADPPLSPHRHLQPPSIIVTVGAGGLVLITLGLRRFAGSRSHGRGKGSRRAR